MTKQNHNKIMEESESETPPEQISNENAEPTNTTDDIPRHENAVESNLHQCAGVGHRHHNLRTDLGALHVHHAGTRVHEKYFKF